MTRAGGAGSVLKSSLWTRARPAAIAAALLGASPAGAGTVLTGAQYELVTPPSLLSPMTPVTTSFPCAQHYWCFTAFAQTTSGVETVLDFGNGAPQNPRVEFDFSAEELLITYLPDPLSTAWVGPPDWSFNGPVFTGAFDPLLSVSGIDPSRVTDTGATLAINWAGLTFGPGAQIDLQFVDPPAPYAVPAPALGAGLPGLVAGLGFVWWRRRRG